MPARADRAARAALLALVLLGGCATTRAARGPTPAERVVEAARALLDRARVEVGGRTFRADCSGFVQGVFSAVDVGLIEPSIGGVSATESILRTLRARGQLRGPRGLRAGDLVFFHDTYDRNGNGLRDDRFTHVALVEGPSPAGGVSLLHFASGRVVRGALDPLRPGLAQDASGEVVNSPLRRGRGRVLAGQLFVRSARPLPR